jgi:hypothetical protein
MRRDGDKQQQVGNLVQQNSSCCSSVLAHVTNARTRTWLVGFGDSLTFVFLQAAADPPFWNAKLHGACLLQLDMYVHKHAHRNLGAA